MNKTINNIDVNFTADHYIYKRDLAKLMAFDTLRSIDIICHELNHNDIFYALNFAKTADHFRVTICTQDFHAITRYQRYSFSFIFRRNGEVKVSVKGEKTPLTPNNCELPYDFDDKFDQFILISNKYSHAMCIPDLKNAADYKYWARHSLVPTLHDVITNVCNL